MKKTKVNKLFSDQIIKLAQELTLKEKHDEVFNLLSTTYKQKGLVHPQFILLLAENMCNRNQKLEATMLVEQACREWPNNFPLAKTKVLLAMEKQNWIDAEIVLSEWYQKNPKTLPFYILLMKFYQQTKNWPKLLEIIEEALSSYSPTVFINILKIQSLIALNQHDEASLIKKQSYELWPQNNHIRLEWLKELLKNKEFSQCLGIILSIPIETIIETSHLKILIQAMIRGNLHHKVTKFLLEKNLILDKDNCILILKHTIYSVDNSLLTVNLRPDEKSPVHDDTQQIIRLCLLELIDNLQCESAYQLIKSFCTAIFEETEELSTLLVICSIYAGKEVEIDNNLWQKTVYSKTITQQNYNILLNITDPSLVPYEVYLYWIENSLPKTKIIERKIDFLTILVSEHKQTEAYDLINQIDIATLNKENKLKVFFLKEKLESFKSFFESNDESMFLSNHLPYETLEDGHIIHYKFSDQTCVIWFTGIILTNAPLFQELCLPIWKKLGISVVVVHDTKRLAALGGFGQHFPQRSISELWLKDFLATRGYYKFATCGTSLAGYSALIYGCNLGAQGILSFAGATYIPSVNEMPIKQGVIALRRVLRSISLDITDVRPLLEKNTNIVVHCHYGIHAGQGFDANQANRIRDLPNITCFGEKHDNHNVINWLFENQRLEKTLTQFIDAIS